MKAIAIQSEESTRRIVLTARNRLDEATSSSIHLPKYESSQRTVERVKRKRNAPDPGRIFPNPNNTQKYDIRLLKSHLMY